MCLVWLSTSVVIPLSFARVIGLEYCRFIMSVCQVPVALSCCLCLCGFCLHVLQVFGMVLVAYVVAFCMWVLMGGWFSLFVSHCDA